MLRNAEKLVGGHTDIANWMDHVLGGNDGKAMHVTLGEKVSEPSEGPMQRDVAFQSLQQDLLNEYRRIPLDHDFGFWIIDIELADGRHEAIALAIDKSDPGNVKMRDKEGNTHIVPFNRLGDRLVQETSKPSWSRIAGIALHRAVETQAALLTIQDELTNPIEHQGCNFVRLDDHRVVANARHLIDDPTWNDDIISGTRELAEDDANRHDLSQNTFVSAAFRDRIKDQGLRVSIDGGEPQPIETADSLVFVQTPDIVGLNHDQRRGLSRLVAGVAMDRAYGAIVGDPELKPELIDVTISGSYNENKELSIDVTFRAPLPKGVTMPTGKGVINGEDCDLLLTMRIQADQLTKVAPQFTLDDPQIEIRTPPRLADRLDRQSIDLDDIAGWMDETLTGESNAKFKPVTLGGTLSEPLGRVSLEKACRNLQDGLTSHLKNEILLDEHNFFIVDVELQSGERRPIGLHVTKDDPNNVEILAYGTGETTTVPLNRLGSQLNDTMKQWQSDRVWSLALHHADEIGDEANILPDEYHDNHDGKVSGDENIILPEDDSDKNVPRNLDGDLLPTKKISMARR